MSRERRSLAALLVLLLGGGTLAAIAMKTAVTAENARQAEPCKLGAILTSYPSYRELGCKTREGRTRCVVDASAADLPESIRCESFDLVPLHASEPGDACAGPDLGRTQSGEWHVLLHTFGWRLPDGGVESGRMLMRETGGGRADFGFNELDAGLADDHYVRHQLVRSQPFCGGEQP